MRLTVFSLFLISPTIACATCKDDIAKLDAASSEKLKTSIQKSSGGQSEAARREATQEENGDGKDGMQAKVDINDARIALGKGDEAACETALSKAQQKSAGP